MHNKLFYKLISKSSFLLLLTFVTLFGSSLSNLQFNFRFGAPLTGGDHYSNIGFGSHSNVDGYPYMFDIMVGYLTPKIEMSFFVSNQIGLGKTKEISPLDYTVIAGFGKNIKLFYTLFGPYILAGYSRGHVKFQNTSNTKLNVDYFFSGLGIDTYLKFVPHIDLVLTYRLIFKNTQEFSTVYPGGFCSYTTSHVNNIVLVGFSFGSATRKH